MRDGGTCENVIAVHVLEVPLAARLCVGGLTFDAEPSTTF